MNFLINIVVLLLCVAILGFGAFQTVMNSDFGQIGKDFEAALSTPLPGGNEFSDEENPSDDIIPDYDGMPDDGNEENGEGAETPDAPTDEESAKDKAEDAFKELFNEHDPNYTELKSELISGMLAGFLGNSGDSGDSGEDGEDGEGGDVTIGGTLDFGTYFDPDFVPEGDADGEGTEDDTEALLSDLLGIYTSHLFQEIDAVKKAHSGASQEEIDAAGAAFAKKETEALFGILEIINNTSEEDPDEETLVDFVDTVVGSNVCLNFIDDIAQSYDSTTDTFKDASENLSEEAKADMQLSIENALDDYRASAEYDPTKEERYVTLADLFGITLTNAVIPTT